MIHIKHLRQLIKLMTENDLSEIDLRDGQEQVKGPLGPSRRRDRHSR